MKDINDTMQEVHAKKEQKKRLQRMKKRKEQKDAKVANARRCFMLGEAVCEYFPDMQKCHLQYNAPEIDDAFREFRAILELLSKEITGQHQRTGCQQWARGSGYDKRLLISSAHLYIDKVCGFSDANIASLK